MNPTAIYSKSGKGVQEASGKTSLLSRADRAVLSAFDGKITVKEAAERIGKPFDAKFEQTIQQLEKDGFVREVSAGTPSAGAKPSPARPAPAAAKPAGGGGGGADLDFTTIMPAYKPPASSPAPDLAAKAREDAERKAKEDQATSFKARQEAEAKAAAAAAAKQRQEAEERARKERDRVAAEAAAKAAAQAKPKAEEKPLFDLDIPAAPAKAPDAQSQAAAFAKAREEAEEKAARERERLKAEAEAKARVELEAKAKSDAEKRAKEEAEARVRAAAEAKAQAEAEAKIKAAREAAVKAAAEAKAKAEAEAKAKLEEAERLRREAEEKARREAEELKRRLEEERKAREEAERKAQEEARRRKEEEERRRREEEERRAREEAERKAREEAERKAAAERKAREEAERKAQEQERARREAEEKARREAEERRRLEEERQAREEEERSREAAQAAERERQEAEAAERRRKQAEKPKRAPTGDAFADSLMADLDSFTEKDDEDRRAKEEAARRENEETAKARAEAERRAQEEAARRKHDEDDRRRREKEEEEARGREKAEAEAREKREREEREEREAREAEERRRREKEEEKEKEKARRKRKGKKEEAPADGDDIGVTDDDLDMDDVREDEKAISADSRKAAKEREREQQEREREAKERAKERAREAKRAKEAPPAAVVGGYAPIRRRRGWGKPIAFFLFIVLAVGLAWLHLMPIDTTEYEKAASEAVGRPVKIASAHFSLYNGLLLRLEGVSVGDVKIATARAYPELTSLFDEKKVFGRVDIDGVSVPQDALGELLAAKIRGDRFAIKRVSAKELKLPGPLAMPTLEADLFFGPDGAVTSASLRGVDGLLAKVTPKGADFDVDITANSFSLPIAPDVVLSGFALKGTASRDHMRIESWGGGTLDGAISGTATVRWGSSWNIDGVVTIRGINAAVFAPALLSDGRAEGTGRFSLSGPDPMKFMESGRIEGNFSVPKGVLGSFDLSRAIQTGGRQAEGRTPFNSLSAQGVFDRGSVALRNVTFSAGALSAGASADIARDGALSGRIVADVRTPTQTLRATVNLGGTVQEPRVRN